MERDRPGQAPGPRRGGVRRGRHLHRLGAVAGHDGIDGFIAGAQQQFAGLRFGLGGAVDGHHDIARFTWHLGSEGAPEPLAIGFDVIRVEDAKIKQVQGFLDKMPG